VTGTVISNNGTVHPNGVGVDSSGDIFLADCSSSYCRPNQTGVYKLTLDRSGGYTVTRIATDTAEPGRTDVDSAGTVFVADAGNNRIVTLTPQAGGTTYTEGQAQDFSGKGPNGVSVARDSFGDLYVANFYDGTVDKLTPGAGGAYAQTTIATIPNGNIYDLAVDGSGNVYVIQQPPGSGSPATVYKIRPLAGGSYAAPLVIATGPTADAIAVDGAGVVYLPDDSSTNATVYTLTPNATGTTYTQSSFDVTGLA